MEEQRAVGGSRAVDVAQGRRRDRGPYRADGLRGDRGPQKE